MIDIFHNPKHFEKVIASSRASIEKEDLAILLPIIRDLAPATILEIGMHQGYSMEVWRKAFNPDLLMGIEKDPPTPVSYVDEPLMFWKYDSHSLATQELIEDMLKIHKAKSIDFLFIDGDHSYPGVKKDFAMYGSLVRPGGIIAFHDIRYHADNTEEVDIFWNDIKHGYLFKEIKKGTNSTGIGVICL